MHLRLKALASYGLITVEGLSARYGVSRKTIYTCLKHRYLPAPTGRSGVWNTWRETDLKAWEDVHPWM